MGKDPQKAKSKSISCTQVPESQPQKTKPSFLLCISGYDFPDSSQTKPVPSQRAGAVFGHISKSQSGEPQSLLHTGTRLSPCDEKQSGSWQDEAEADCVMFSLLISMGYLALHLLLVGAPKMLAPCYV